MTKPRHKFAKCNRDCQPCRFRNHGLDPASDLCSRCRNISLVTVHLRCQCGSSVPFPTLDFPFSIIFGSVNEKMSRSTSQFILTVPGCRSIQMAMHEHVRFSLVLLHKIDGKHEFETVCLRSPKMGKDIQRESPTGRTS